MAGYRPEYTKKEDEKIVAYILEHKAHYMLRGNVLWKEMEGSGEFERTWQSLKERFRKKIISNLHLLDLPDKDKQAIQLAYQQTSTSNTKTFVGTKQTMFTVSDSDSE